MKTFVFDNRRNVRSPDLTRLMVGKPLTDARIAYYASRGRYGPEYKQQQKDRQKKKRSVRSSLDALAKEFA